MRENIWEGKPEKRSGSHQYMDFLYYPDEAMDTWIEKLSAYYEPIEMQAEALRFLFGDEGINAENLAKIQMWRRKAEMMADALGVRDAALSRALELEAKLEVIKTDLVEWSRSHDPPEQEEQIHLWCSINRLIGDHFGTDWMKAED